MLVLLVRPDPKTIAPSISAASAIRRRRSPRLRSREIIRRPGVLPALVAAVASFAGMVSIMNLTGYIVIDHGHHQTDVFTVISLHIVGMYALVLVIGELIDRLGRKPGQVSGLLLMGVSILGLAWFDSVLWTSVSLFGLGLGWNVSYVAAATELADRALPAERGQADRLLGSALGLPRRGARAARWSRLQQRSASAPCLRRSRFRAACPRSGSCYNPPPAH